MLTPSTYRRLLAVFAAAVVGLTVIPLRETIAWHAHPFAGVLIDPDGLVSSFGLPTWDGFKKGLRYPDEILEVDGKPLGTEGPYRATVWDRAIDAAAAARRPRVHVRVRSAGGDRELDLAVSSLDAAGFWLNGGLPFAAASLYAAGALVALAASPRGRLARTFAKTTLAAALFLFTIFDYHTSRRLVPFFHLAFALVPMAAFALPLRIPDDARALSRHPWLIPVLDGIGLVFAGLMVGCQSLAGSSVRIRSIWSWLLVASFLFFAATLATRFVRAKAERRAMMRALLIAMVPTHLVLGGASFLAALSLWGGTTATCVLPAAMFTPFASIVALVRHDLWGSRALLSRVLTRGIIVAVTIGLAVTLATILASAYGVPLGGALLSAAVAGMIAGLLVGPALGAGDRALFPSRAVYKPTTAQLSEELTVISMPDEVANAVERTVRRWLPCDTVEFRPTGARAEMVSDTSETASGIRQQTIGFPDSASPLGDALTIDVMFRRTRLATLHVRRKRGGALFTTEDVDLLSTIANQAALALSHAYNYEELELRRRQQAAAWRGEREALLETVAAEIAHEVRYPINYFRAIFQRGREGQHLDAEEIDIGCDEVERLERLVSGLRRVVSRRLERTTVGVPELLIKTERLLRDQLGRRALHVAIDGVPSLLCDADQITQVLVNLLSNALDAAGEAGTVGVSWTDQPRGGELTVWDTGPGFTGDAARLFAPWFTTKARGTGLGLAITLRIVRAHGWTIEPQRTGGTTRFVISIPESDITSTVIASGREVA